MGFHSVMSAACNKNMGYGSDDGDIRKNSKGYGSEWRKTVSNKVVAAVWFT